MVRVGFNITLDTFILLDQYL